MTSPTGNFSVHRPGGHSWAVADDEWAIWLPPSSDVFVITADADREEALAGARRFRAELDAAIAELESDTGGTRP